MPDSLGSTLPPQLREKLDSGEVDTTPVPSRKTIRRSREDSYAALDTVEDQARAGASDAWLMARAGVTKSAVLSWRSSRHITRPRSKREQVAARFHAVDCYGDGSFTPCIQAVAEDRIAGRWEVPEFVTHRDLNYTQFCRHIYYLHVFLGSTYAGIGEALGMTESDIELGVEMWKRHLCEAGTTCPRCGNAMDPRFGKTCSRRCGS